jgi:phytoene dehydrogenase-like protein
MTTLALAGGGDLRALPGRERPDPARTAIVIGAGLGGLSAAIHLRLAGWQVRLLEANERVGGRAHIIERDGFRFDAGPSLLNYPWVFEELFRAAGRSLREYVRLLPVDPSVSSSGSSPARAPRRWPTCATRRSSIASPSTAS